MKKRSPTNVRVVKCPKCSKLLPEPTDVPFYICGGCSTYLQAKHYKKENSRKPEVSEDSSNVIPQSNHQGGESSDSSPQSIFSAQNSPDPCREGQGSNLEVADSIREASSSNNLCTTETKDPSSYPSTEDGKFDSETQTLEQFADGDASLITGANAPKGSENKEDSVPTLNFKESRKGEQVVAEEIGAQSYNRDAAQLLNASEEVRNSKHSVAEDLHTGNSSREASQSYVSPTLAEPVGKELPNEDDLERESDHNVVVKDRSGMIGIEGEFSSTDDSHFPESNKSSVSVEDREGEEEIVAVAGGMKSGIAASSEKPAVLQHEEVSGLSPENKEKVYGKDIQDVKSEIIPMSNQVSLCENKEAHETLIENRESFAAEVQDEEPSVTKEETCEEKLHTEIIPSVEVDDSRERKKLPSRPSGQDNDLKYADDDDKVMDVANILPEAVLPCDPLGDQKEAVLQPHEVNLAIDKNQHLPPPGSKTSVVIEKLKTVDYSDVPITASKSLEDIGDTSGQNSKDSNQRIILNGLPSTSSGKTLEDAEIVDTKLEVVEFPKVLPRSPTRGSSVYDGSVSSYDGNDDQNLHVDTEKKGRNSEVVDRDMIEGEIMLDHFAATNHQIKCSSSNNQTVPHSGVGSPENSGGRRASGRNTLIRRRTEENFPPRYSVQLTNSEMAYESSVSSNLMHDEFQSHPNSYLPPQGYRDIETRANRRHLHGNDMQGRIRSDYGDWVREGVPAQRSYCSSAYETYPTRSYYPRERSCELHYPSGANYTHAPYTGEAFRSGYQQRFHDYPYLPSEPPPSELRWSPSQLSPAKGDYYRDWNNVRSWKQPVDSYPASPQYVDSVDSYSWGGYDVSTGEQMHRYETVDNNRLQVRKKQQAVQKHCRPVAGGAPFVSCYKCAVLLQLPSDFLLFKSRRIHRLKCTSCSTILKFQLERGDHLVPYTPQARPSTPREARGNKFNNTESTSQQGNNNEYQAAPRRNTSSMNRNQVQYPAVERSSTHDSSGAAPERQSKVTWKKSLSKGKRAMVESGVGASTSSSMDNTPTRQMKVSGEQQPGRSTSPLHRLMGYSSPSQVLYGSRSTYPETP